jgi:hypothetical protein
MMKYRKKPVVIQAAQWVGNPAEMPIPPAPSTLLREARGVWMLQTLEGWYQLRPNDWIIRGVKGEYYPCRPDIFEMTYEPAEDVRAPQSSDAK